MSVLSAPRHPLIDEALRDARAWCIGQVIDDQPAIAHAVRVAETLSRYAPDVAPNLICAALLHDSPDFAPPDLDLDGTLTRRYGPETTRVVRALEREHVTLDRGDPPLPVDDPPALLTCVSDKIVAMSSLAYRARRSGDIDRFFNARPALLALIPFFRAFHDTAAQWIPSGMATRFGAELVLLERVTIRVRRRRN